MSFTDKTVHNIHLRRPAMPDVDSHNVSDDDYDFLKSNINVGALIIDPDQMMTQESDQIINRDA